MKQFNDPARQFHVPYIAHDETYYARAIDSLNPGLTLELGSANGRVGSAIRSRRRDVTLIGLEIDSELVAATPPGIYEQIHHCDIQLPLPLPETLGGNITTVLALDLLEHLSYPDRVLQNLLEIVPNAVYVIGIPNFLHYRNRLRVLAGKWRYSERGGIYDSTHLRFYGLRNLDQLVPSPLQITSVVATGWEPRGERLRDRPLLEYCVRAAHRVYLRLWVRSVPSLFARSFLISATRRS